jgi:hypothetical protein
MSQFQPESITALIDDYGLNTERIPTEKIVAAWLQQYEATWIVKAIVEAVFRGRYQIKSVDDILKQWQRLGKPRCSFKADFERERLKKILAPTELVETTTEPNHPQPIDRSIAKQLNSQSPIVSSPSNQNTHALNPEELEPFHHHHRWGGTSLPCTWQPDPIQSQLNNPQNLPPQTLPATNNNLGTNEIPKHTPPPPRWWLLDKLKIAIAGVEIDKPVMVRDGAETAVKKRDKTDEHPFGRQPQPEKHSKIQNTSH